MLAVKCGATETARMILEFGIDPAVLFLRDADGFTPLHVAVQNADTVVAGLLLKHGPTQLLYTENSVGQTPLDLAGLKGLPRATSVSGVTPAVLPWHAQPQYTLRKAPSFDVEKQKIEIPKLRATLDTLLSDGTIVHGTKLATELLAFASRMEGRLAAETSREDVTDTWMEIIKLYPLVPRGTTENMYILFREAAATRPGTRQLVHLVDVQRSVQRNLAHQVQVPRWNQYSRAAEEPKEIDSEYQRIVELKARSVFAPGSLIIDNRIIYYPSYNSPLDVDLYGVDIF